MQKCACSVHILFFSTDILNVAYSNTTVMFLLEYNSNCRVTPIACWLLHLSSDYKNAPSQISAFRICKKYIFNTIQEGEEKKKQNESVTHLLK